jgi:hypothetical protein
MCGLRRQILQCISDGLCTWEGLVPAVFGVSVDEFEAGWQAYLARHYDPASGHLYGHEDALRR